MLIYMLIAGTIRQQTINVAQSYSSKHSVILATGRWDPRHSTGFHESRV